MKVSVCEDKLCDLESFVKWKKLNLKMVKQIKKNFNNKT